MSSAGPELSRIVDLERIGATDSRITVTADAAERAALAQRFDIVSVDGLTAELRLRRLSSGTFRLTGELRGDVVQRCVVTLEPVPARIEESFVEVYARDLPGQVAELEIDPLDDEAPEPLIGSQLDVGEIVAQYLSLGLPPYPRAPGAVLDAIGDGDSDEGAIDVRDGDSGKSEPGEGRQRPFGALASLRRKD